MSKLQQLLDEKWPMHENDRQDSFWKKIALRDAFTQGYNAAKAEINEEADKRQAPYYLNSRKPIDDTKF
jgi:hypothetical protein